MTGIRMKVKKKIAIWGTGAYGSMAYCYYNEKCLIECFIDSNKKKWGKQFNGIAICSPDVLKKMDVDVVIAMKYGVNEVEERLWNEYHISNVIQFQIAEQPRILDKSDCEIQEDTVIVAFSGGMGNQMFQYALLRKLELDGKHALSDFSMCLRLGTPDFLLMKVFPNIQLASCSEKQKQKLIAMNTRETGDRKKFVIYREANIYEVEQKGADTFLLDITGGYIQGWHQSCFFADSIREALLWDFMFDITQKAELKEISEQIRDKNAVGVHIRRGDYLEGNNAWLYGDICTPTYYKKAIEYIQANTDNVIFCFFSNDIEWVKNKYRYENAMFISETMFIDYQDWYDMYLMSQCKHNIIANSTFSWWGAWLNQNPEKIVIAPKKWVNGCDFKDIYPFGWITI